MNKKTSIIIVVILGTIISGMAYLLMSPDVKNTNQSVNSDASKTGEQTTPTIGVQSPSTTDSKASTKGSYVDYKGDVVANTSGTKLLFFHAPWCPQCRDLEDDIEKSGVPSDVTIIKVDYDSNQELRKKYGVTIQTTFVRVDDSGGLVEKFVAYEDPTLNSVVKNLL